MPVPEFDGRGLVPPFIGVSPADSSNLLTPYLVHLVEVASALGSSQERRALLRSLVSYRASLRDAGLDARWQWVAGSFVENVDRVRAPRDIDLVTFYSLKGTMKLRTDENLDATPTTGRPYREPGGSLDHLFDRDAVHSTYGLDSFFVNTDNADEALAQTSYWLGLFGHQRDTFYWKGLFQVPFLDDDAAVHAVLDGLDGG